MHSEYFTNTIIITNNENKKELLIQKSLSNSFTACEIVDERTFIGNILGTYNKEAIVYVSKQYNIRIDNVKDYISWLPFIDIKKDYVNEKLSLLSHIKSDLLDKNLYSVDDGFIIKAQKHAIYLYHINYVSKELKKTLETINKTYNIINDEIEISNQKTLYEYESIEEEVSTTAFDIADLIYKGKDENKISVVCNAEYYFLIKKYFTFYNIAYNIFDSISLYETSIGKEFIEMYKENGDVNLSLSMLKRQVDVTSTENNKILKSIINFINSNLNLLEGELSTFIYFYKQVTIPTDEYTNAVKIVSTNHVFESNDIVYVLGVNSNGLIKSYKDEDFLTDDLKKELHISTSEDNNNQSIVEFNSLINQSGVFHISYSLKNSFSVRYPHYIISKLNLTKAHHSKNENISYSKLGDLLELGSILDKISDINKNLRIDNLYNTLDIDYRTFNNQFTIINKGVIKEYILNNKKIRLSYSAIDNFYKCSYKYYLSNILYLNDPETNFSAKMGTSFHNIIEGQFNDDFDFETYFANEKEKYSNEKEKMFIEKFKDEIKTIVKINQDNMALTQLKNVAIEKRIEVKYEEPLPITFIGFIDKLMYTEIDKQKYVAIIDLKTGNPTIKLDLIDYGLSMQLPVYLYLIKHVEGFENSFVVGIYLQKLLTAKAKDISDFYEFKKKQVQLEGYSINNKEILEKFDSSFRKSEMIKSMKITKDNQFNRYSKVLSKDAMDELSNKVKKKIMECISAIEKEQFTINPKNIDGINQSCDFCKYKCICNVTNKDFVYINTEESQDSED